MNRSNYTCDLEPWTYVRWRGAVSSAIRGSRGQAFLMELLSAMEGMEQKELIENSLEKDGQYCALGVVGKSRGIDLRRLDPDDYDHLAKVFGISAALVQEIEWINDQWSAKYPWMRWDYVYTWVRENIKYNEAKK